VGYYDSSATLAKEAKIKEQNFSSMKKLPL